MTSETYNLFVHTDLIRIHCNLGCNTLIIDLRIDCKFIHLLDQSRLIVLDDLWGFLLDISHNV